MVMLSTLESNARSYLTAGTSGNRNAKLVVSRMDSVRPPQPTSATTDWGLLIGPCTILVKLVHSRTKIRETLKKKPHYDG